MKKIIPFLLFPLLSYCQIAPDKQKHFIAGAAVSAVTYQITYNKTRDRNKAFWYSTLSSLIVGTTKELADSREVGNRFDVEDLAATVGGGITAGITINILANKKPRHFWRGL